MKKWLLHTAGQLQAGQLLCGGGLIVCVFLLGLEAPAIAAFAAAALETLAAVWTFASALTYPQERREELPRSFFWSHGALTALSAALLVLTAGALLV